MDLAEVRRERDGQEEIRVRSAAAELWRETFDEHDADAPDDFAEFAQRAVSDSMHPADED